MSEWKSDVLENHVSLITKGTTPTSLGRAFQENGINFIKAESITDKGKFIPDLFAFIDTETHEVLKRSQLNAGDILFSIAGVLGRVAIVNNEIIPANTNQALAIIRLSNSSDLERDFLKYFLNSEFIKEQIRRINVQAAQANFSLGDINRLHILFPKEKSEQRRIASILSTADAVIEKTQAAIAKYKAIKQGMLHDLFTRGIDPKTGKLRPKYEDAPELYKECSLGWVVREWEVEELMHYLSFISYGFTNPMPETGEGPYLITAANVNGGRIQYETCRKTSIDAFNTLLTDKSRPKRNDILLTKDGTLGRIALVEKENLCINQSVAVLRPNAKINPLFLKILLESPSYQKKMLDEAGGSTIKHIYITIVDKMLLAIPKNIQEQNEIALRLTTIETKIQTEQRYLEKMEALKGGLMGDLLRGEKQIRL